MYHCHAVYCITMCEERYYYYKRLLFYALNFQLKRPTILSIKFYSKRSPSFALNFDMKRPPPLC